MRKKDPRTEETKRLIRKLRKHPRYLSWKRHVLAKDGWTEEDKKIQVHHKKELSSLLWEYDIRTVDEALECDALWKVSLGITLSRGEHFIMTKLRRYKYLTNGFIRLLEDWLDECKQRPRKRSLNI